MSSLYPSRVRPLRKGTHKKRTCSPHEQTADSKRKSPKYGGKKYAIARNVFPIRKGPSPIGPFHNLGHYPFRSASNPMASTAFIMYMLITHNGYGLEKAFRCALFQVVSFITTTGLFNDDAGQWPHITWIVLGICMFTGACAGSTSGGFKCIRGVMIIKVLRNEFRRILHPNAVLPVKINGQNVPQDKIMGLVAFFAVYIIMAIITATIMIAVGIDHTNAITIAFSCLSNVGPTLGTEIGPVMSWSSLPDNIKWICSLLMLMGRLEIMSVLVLFTRSYWKEN